MECIGLSVITDVPGLRQASLISICRKCLQVSHKASPGHTFLLRRDVDLNRGYRDSLQIQVLLFASEAPVSDAAALVSVPAAAVVSAVFPAPHPARDAAIRPARHRPATLFS